MKTATLLIEGVQLHEGFKASWSWFQMLRVSYRKSPLLNFFWRRSVQRRSRTLARSFSFKFYRFVSIWCLVGDQKPSLHLCLLLRKLFLERIELISIKFPSDGCWLWRGITDGRSSMRSSLNHLVLHERPFLWGLREEQRISYRRRNHVQEFFFDVLRVFRLFKKLVLHQLLCTRTFW